MYRKSLRIFGLVIFAICVIGCGKQQRPDTPSGTAERWFEAVQNNDYDTFVSLDFAQVNPEANEPKFHKLSSRVVDRYDGTMRVDTVIQKKYSDGLKVVCYVHEKRNAPDDSTKKFIRVEQVTQELVDKLPGITSPFGSWIVMDHDF